MYLIHGCEVFNETLDVLDFEAKHGDKIYGFTIAGPIMVAARPVGAGSREAWIDVLAGAKLVALEEASALPPQMVAAIAHAEDMRLRLEAARQEVLAGVDSLPEHRRHEVLIDLERFYRARHEAQARPHEADVNPHRAS